MASHGDVRAGKAFVETYVKNAKLFKGLAAAQRRLREFGDGAALIGRRMLQLSAAIGIVAGLGGRTFAGFEDQMKAVQAVTGATADEYARLYNLAKKLGATTSFTAADVAGAEVNLGRAGFKPAEIEAATESTLNLARATGTELPRSAEIAAGTLRAFNLEANQMTRVADVLVATANSSAQTLEELGESMKYAAPVAQEFGMSLEQTSKMLGVMANMQIKGSMAGTTMRQILLQVSDPAIAKRIRDVAGEEALAALQAGRLGDAMILIGKAMGDMTAMERVAFGKELFGARAVSGALKLARSDFPELSKAIDNAGGVAKETADIMDSGLGGVIRRLLSLSEGVRIALGEVLAESLEDMGESVKVILDNTKAWIERNKSLITSIASLGVKTALTGAALFVVGKVISGVAAALGALRAASIFFLANPMAIPFVALTAILGGLAYTIGELVSYTAKLSNAQQDALSAGDKQRKSAKLQMERLEQLADKQRLTNEEMKEAKSIIASLQGAYGNLGLSVDGVTGKISGMTSAQSKLNEAMRNAALLELEAAMAEVQRNLDELGREAGTALWWQFWKRGTESIGAEVSTLYKQMFALQARYKAMQAGKSGALTGEPIGGEGIADRIQAGKVAAEQQEEWERELGRLRLSMIEDQHMRALFLIDEEYEHRIQKAKEAGQDITTLEELRAAEIAKINADYARKKEEEERRAAETAAELRETIDEQTANEVARLRIEATTKGHEKEMALLALRQQKELQEAKEAGANLALLQQKHGLERQQLGLKNLAESTSRVAGTFSGSAVAGLGVGSVQERIARAVEQQLVKQQGAEKWWEKMFAELKRITLEAAT